MNYPQGDQGVLHAPQRRRARRSRRWTCSRRASARSSAAASARSGSTCSTRGWSRSRSIPTHYGWYRDLRRYGTVPHAGFGARLRADRRLRHGSCKRAGRDPVPENTGQRTVTERRRVARALAAMRGAWSRCCLRGLLERRARKLFERQRAVVVGVELVEDPLCWAVAAVRPSRWRAADGLAPRGAIVLSVVAPARASGLAFAAGRIGGERIVDDEGDAGLAVSGRVRACRGVGRGGDSTWPKGRVRMRSMPARCDCSVSQPCRSPSRLGTAVRRPEPHRSMQGVCPR